jgi:GGDEF domain-containing protein
LATYDELAKSLPPGGSFCVFVDVDSLIWVNDIEGFARADAALVAVGNELERLGQRYRGTAVRIGGDDFVVSLPGCARSDGRAFAAEIDKAVAGLQLAVAPVPNSRCPIRQVTVSTLVFWLEAEVLTGRVELKDRLSGALADAKTQAGRRIRVMAELASQDRARVSARQAACRNITTGVLGTSGWPEVSGPA